jgi:hypothetical protein
LAWTGDIRRLWLIGSEPSRLLSVKTIGWPRVKTAKLALVVHDGLSAFNSRFDI